MTKSDPSEPHRTLNAATRPTVAAGDRIELRRDGKGTVVAVIDEEPPPVPRPGRDWNCLGRGIVVHLDSGSLVHIREPLFELIGRA